MKKMMIMACLLSFFALPLSAATNNSLTNNEVTSTSMNDKNQKQGAAFLENNKKKKGIVTTASGLQYEILEPGNGKKPSLADTVTVDYEGKLINGEVFDSSYKRGQPISFPLGQVIQGWQEGLQLMKEGATWMLYIPSDLAYGSSGAGGAIGPNETLIFKVHLIAVK